MELNYKKLKIHKVKMYVHYKPEIIDIVLQVTYFYQMQTGLKHLSFSSKD